MAGGLPLLIVHNICYRSGLPCLIAAKATHLGLQYILLSKSCPRCLIQCLHVFTCCSELQCGTVQHSTQGCTAFEVSFGNQASHSRLNERCTTTADCSKLAIRGWNWDP
ncbi:hypothetical protein S83_031324 [Arachis hypogaea]